MGWVEELYNNRPASITTTPGVPGSVPAGPATLGLPQPVEKPEPVAQEHKDQSLLGAGLGAVTGAAGSAIGAVGTALDVGNKYVTRPGMGALYQGAAGDPLLEAIVFGNGIPGFDGISDEQRQAILDADSNTEAFHGRFEDNPWGKLAVEVAVDPLNLASGAGTVGKVAKGARAAGKLTTANRLEDVARGLNAVDSAQALPITAAQRGIRKVTSGDNLIARGLAQSGNARRTRKSREVSQALTHSDNAFGPNVQPIHDDEIRSLGAMLDNDPSTVMNLSTDELQRMYDSKLISRPMKSGIRHALDRRGAWFGKDFNKYPELADELIAADKIGPDELRKTKYMTPGQQHSLRNAFGQHMLDEGPGASPVAKEWRRRLKDTASEAEFLGPQHQFEQLAADASLDDTLTTISNNAGITTVDPVIRTQVKDALQPLVGVNPEHFQARELFDHPDVRPFIEQALQTADPAAQRGMLASAMDELNFKWSAFGLRHPALGGLMSSIGSVSDAGRKGSKAFGKFDTNSRLNKEEIRILADIGLLDEIKEFDVAFTKSVDEVLPVLSKVNARETVIDAVNDGTTIRELMQLRSHAAEAERVVIDKFVKEQLHLNVDDLKTVRAGFLNRRSIKGVKREGITDRYVKHWAKENNIPINTPPRWIPSGMRKIAAGWREQALVTPRYHLANAMDMVIKSRIHGVMPVKPQTAANRATRWGIGLPEGVRVMLERAEYTSPEEFAQPGSPSQLSKLPVVGGVFGSIVDRNRALGRWLEDSFRSAAWVKGTEEHLEILMPRFTDEIQRGATAYDVDASGVLRFLDERGVDFSRHEIAQKVLTETGDGRLAQEVSLTWERAVNEASQSGLNLSNLVHFDYLDERVAEINFGVRDWAPFHFWATRNIPYYIEQMAAHPFLMRLWQTYNQVSDEEREMLGLTSRFRQTLPADIPLVDPFIELFLGEGTAYFNPLVALSIADQAKPRYVPEEVTPIGEGLIQAGRIGLGPAPWINIPLSAITGIYGNSAEPDSVARLSFLPEHLVGVSPETPVRAAHKYLRENFSGEKQHTLTDSGYMDYMVKKRIAEMSIEQTNQPNHPDYVQAMADPESAIFQDAYAQVKSDRFAMDVMGTVNPFPTKFLPDTEAVVRQANADLPDNRGSELNKLLVEHGNPATAYWRTGGDARQAQINAGFASEPDKGDAPANSGRPSNLFARYSAQGSTGTGNAGVYPFYDQYVAWRNSMPRGSDISVQAFLAQSK